MPHLLLKDMLLLFIFITLLPAGKLMAETKSTEASVQTPLILAIHPYLPREEIISRFTPLANYISKSIGQNVELKIGSDYEDHINAIGNDSVDIAYLGPASYVELVYRYGKIPLLARQEINGQPFMHGEIIVREDSKTQTLAELKGKRFAFTDAKSTLTKLSQHMLKHAGVPLVSLGGYDYITGHKNVSLAVLAGDYDAGAVKSEVYKEFAEKKLLRSLAQTYSVTDHLFVSSHKLSEPLIKKLRELFLTLNESENGRSILLAIHPNMTSFVGVSDNDYDSLRKIMK